MDYVCVDCPSALHFQRSVCAGGVCGMRGTELCPSFIGFLSSDTRRSNNQGSGRILPSVIIATLV